MIYTTFQNKSLSRLGMGCMRLPTTDTKEIDVPATKAMIDRAVAAGINYFDTAWGYHSEMSECVVGECLSSYPRESYYLATKFPGYSAALLPQVEAIFEKQLKKCKVDYFDFYLFHNVCEANIDGYLAPKHGIFEYLMKQKENGRIRHLGFSVHGTLKTMRRFLEAYGQAMEFCQVQLNWLDRSLQNAEEKIKLLNEYHIPVWVMEPLRGGRLVDLSEAHTARLKEARPDEGIPAWSFRYLMSLPETAVILSGMSNMEQLEDNLATFTEEKPLTEEEMSLLFAIAEEMKAGITVPCTGCRYCVDYCPQGLDIPELLSLYNDHGFSGGGFLAPMVLASLPDDKHPSACLSCRSCEEVCPQQIRISEAMERFSSMVAKRS